MQQRLLVSAGAGWVEAAGSAEALGVLPAVRAAAWVVASVEPGAGEAWAVVWVQGFQPTFEAQPEPDF